MPVLPPPMLHTLIGGVSAARTSAICAAKKSWFSISVMMAILRQLDAHLLELPRVLHLLDIFGGRQLPDMQLPGLVVNDLGQCGEIDHVRRHCLHSNERAQA